MNQRDKRVALVLAGAAILGGLLLAMGTSPANAGPLVEMLKSPTCGCCSAWLEVMADAGYRTSSKAVEDMDAVKDQAGVPAQMRSCHTAFVEGYWVEGHVPPQAVQRMLAERPAIVGLAVPGMPHGSPGMAGEKEGPLVVFAVHADGTTEPYATY